jgi:hypothetical protein
MVLSGVKMPDNRVSEKNDANTLLFLASELLTYDG